MSTQFSIHPSSHFTLNLTEKWISPQVANCTSGTSAVVPLSLALHLLVLLLLPGKACRRLAVPAQVSNTRAACTPAVSSVPSGTHRQQPASACAVCDFLHGEIFTSGIVKITQWTAMHRCFCFFHKKDLGMLWFLYWYSLWIHYQKISSACIHILHY